MSRARDKSKKRKSLARQLHERMEALKCIGESRHQAKAEYREMKPDDKNKNKTVGIHSYQTYSNYKQTMIDMTEWIKEHHNEVKNIDDISRDIAIEYIKHKADNGSSSYSYSKDMGAISKVLGYDLTKKECNVANKSYKDITNNRELKEHHKKINFDNYRDEITVITGTGIRRASVTNITKSNFNYSSDGKVESITVKEKGGKVRTSNILQSHQESIKSILDNKTDDEVLFEKIPNRLPCHRFRQSYAKGMYDQIVENGGGNGETYRGYDKGALEQVSKEIGHKRLDVVVYHYLKAAESIEEVDETVDQQLYLYDIDDVEKYY